MELGKFDWNRFWEDEVVARYVEAWNPARAAAPSEPTQVGAIVGKPEDQ